MVSKPNKLIRFAEYAAVSAAVVGAIATLTTKRPAYAVVPLSLSAALSLVSRQQQETAVAQQQQALRDEVAALDRKVSQQVAEIQSTFASRSGLSELSDELERSRTQLDLLASKTTVEQLRDRLLQLSDDFEQSRKHVETLASQTAVEKLSGDLSDLGAELASGLGRSQTRIDTEIARIDTLASQGRVDELAAQVDRLQTENPTIRTEISQLSTELSQTQALAEDFISLRRDFDRFKAHIERLIDQRDSKKVTEPSTKALDPIPQLPTDDDFDLDINLGIDFGTGYTKVCFYDVGREQAEVVTFSERRDSTENLAIEEILLPTKLAILEDGTLLSGLTVAEWEKSQATIRTTIDFIKMRLAHLDVGEGQWRLEQIPELDDEATVESCCAYYLAQVIARSQEWITTYRPDLFAGQTVRWSINVGVPVEYCDSDVLDRFKKVLDLSWLLRYTPTKTSSLTLPALNQLVQHLQTWKVSNLKTELDCTTTPEIAAAVWSFLSSREAQNGFYTFFDVGDGTLDGASFRFCRGTEGDLEVDFYSGQVKPLGVTAFTQQAADELGSAPQTIKVALTSDANDELHSKMKGSKIRRNVQSLVASVVFDGKEKHYSARRSSASDDIGDQLKVFVGGGGGNTSFFQNTIEATHRDFQQGNADIPPYQIRQIPPPKTLAVNGLNPDDFNRFAVAYGLCIPNWERPEIKLPSQVEDADSYLEIDDSNVTRYEDTRDLM